jgi:hypothetical protein
MIASRMAAQHFPLVKANQRDRFTVARSEGHADDECSFDYTCLLVKSTFRPCIFDRKKFYM